MRRKSRAVKGRRSYDASLRREQAHRNHDRIIEMAQQRFLRDGYGPTTIAAIAEDARVSVDTIYKSFGGKPGLIRAMGARALQGTGAAPAEQRSDALQARERDPRKLISRWGVFVTEIAPLAAPIILLVRDAAGSFPELRPLLEELTEGHPEHSRVSQQQPVHLHHRDLAPGEPQHEHPSLRSQRPQAVRHPVASHRIQHNIDRTFPQHASHRIKPAVRQHGVIRAAPRMSLKRSPWGSGARRL